MQLIRNSLYRTLIKQGIYKEFQLSVNKLKKNEGFCSKKSQLQTYNHLSTHRWLDYDETHKKSLKTHKSNAEQMIHRVPVIQVHSDIVRCIGGTQLNAGHPQVYIQLNTRNEGQIQTCKYCGLRYQKSSQTHSDEHTNHH